MLNSVTLCAEPVDKGQWLLPLVAAALGVLMHKLRCMHLTPVHVHAVSCWRSFTRWLCWPSQLPTIRLLKEVVV